MNLNEWLEYGYNQGWVGPDVCATHDGLPTSEEEELAWDEDDACIHILRLYESAEVKAAVEKFHGPSLWRASNRGYTVITQEEN